MTHQRRSILFNCVFAVILLLVVNQCQQSEAKRFSTSSRKTSSSSNGGYSTRRQPTSNNNNGHVTPSQSNSHADVAKLSYPNYNSQPNRPAANSNPNPSAIGWNVPNKQQGPPPAYSATNPAGGGRTNMHEPAPAYSPNHAPPPSYGASYPQQPAGATYHSPGQIPAGATYYPSAGHMPAGAGYNPSGGHYPAASGGYGTYGGGYGGGAYGGYGGAPAGVPHGATYLPAGASLPQGATYYSQPPQQTSSGLGFGTGLLAGGLGGALLGHALTPTQTRVVEQAPASGGANGDGRVIIINNGQPGAVTTNADGTTIITTGGMPANGTATDSAVATNVPLASFDANNTAVNAANVNAAQPQQPNAVAGDAATQPEQQPAPGGIICVPVRVNETDPNNAEKMIEIEKIACYPAPPPPPQQQPGAPFGNETTAPLAPMNPLIDGSSQQLQQSTLLPNDSAVRMQTSGAETAKLSLFFLYAATLLTMQLTFNSMK